MPTEQYCIYAVRYGSNSAHFWMARDLDAGRPLLTWDDVRAWQKSLQETDNANQHANKSR